MDSDNTSFVVTTSDWPIKDAQGPPEMPLPGKKKKVTADGLGDKSLFVSGFNWCQEPSAPCQPIKGVYFNNRCHFFINLTVLYIQHTMSATKEKVCVIGSGNWYVLY
jgi:hypothetical protein